MIWSLRAAAALALAWLVFLASPFVALHRLGRAIEEGDLAVVRERVNFRGVRVSLTKQIVAAYVNAAGGSSLGADRQLAVQVGMQVAEPVVETLLSPADIIDLLDDGRPQRLLSLQLGGGPPPASGSAESEPAGRPPEGVQAPPEPVDSLPAIRIARLLKVNSLRSAYRTYARSEMRGFRHVLISLPPERPVEDRFRLRMRLSGWTWKLISLEMPDSVLQRVLRRIPEPLLKRGDLGKSAAGDGVR